MAGEERGEGILGEVGRGERAGERALCSKVGARLDLSGLVRRGKDVQTRRQSFRCSAGVRRGVR